MKRNDKTLDLSVVVPVYNERDNIAELSQRLTKVLRGLKLSYEVLFVDDGSDDRPLAADAPHGVSGTLAEILKAKKLDKNISALTLAKNSGKSQAYIVGFDAARGDIVVTMDGDLQDRPEQIPDFIAKINEVPGYDLVTGWKYTGKGKRAKSSERFNALVSRVTRLHIHDTNCPFKAYRRDVVKNIWVYGNLYRFIPAMAYWQGYKIAEIKVENDPRAHGVTKYGPGRWMGGFIDLLTVFFLTQYIKRPLYLFSIAGTISFTLGFVIELYILIDGIMKGFISHTALMLLGIVFIIASIQFISTGLLAEMIIRVRQELQRDVPVYTKI
ncbi:MAG: glycosyltransferase family 2 protein [Candidatus Edwardsbacteria bacterium]|jgi:glycosyltransferase involved in cell wall biosynthesis|nr:glycosyltransferase family 2 protein [Candidatus Edwardsbacteria bacterium]